MLDSIEEQYLLVGRVNRTHGVKGEVLVISELDAPDLFDEIDLVHLQNSRGDLIPARIESARVQQKQGRLSFFVQFEHVADRNEAEQLKHFPVYVAREVAEPLLKQEDELVDFTDFKVVDPEGNRLGEVEEVIVNPAHPILQVATKHGKELLVPFVDEYVSTFDEAQKTITCQNLNQLEGL